MDKPKKTKSRTGCRMCKTKRLKCDETKPACNQCVRRGRQCPGYKQMVKWSTITTLTGKTKPEPERSRSSRCEVIPIKSLEPEAPQNDASSGLLDLPDPLQGGEQGDRSHTDATYTDINDLLDVLESEGNPWTAPGCDELDAPVLDIGNDESIQLQAGFDWASFDDAMDPSLVQDDDDRIIEDMTIDDAVSPKSITTTRGGHLSLVSKQNTNVAKFPALNPVDLPTTLVDYWFTHVCSMWCVFDSSQNWLRNLASNTWSHSEPVYYALQAMSASVLVDSLPHLKQTLPSLTVQAAQSIQRAVDANAQTGSQKKALPADLLLAILGMGTSICWADPRNMGFWFLDKARGLLKQYSDESGPEKDDSSHQTMQYFQQALVYWEMLANVVTKDYQHILQTRRKKFKKRIRRAMSMEGSNRLRGADKPSPAGPEKPHHRPDPVVHPWTGVSGDIQQTFGLVMGLCQNRCVSRNVDTNLTADNLCDALCDIELAHDLERELLDFDFRADPDSANISTGETGDPKAPVAHLIDTAEAYRLAALLHLYLTFSDLEVKTIRNTDTADTDGTWFSIPPEMQRDHALVTLTLQLVEVLQRVPADSGARCIQPILLISAAAGLRFDIPTQTARSSNRIATLHPRGTMINQSALSDAAAADLAGFSSSNPNGTLGRDFSLSSAPGFVEDEQPEVQLTSLTLEISAARRFIVHRLGSLQQSLPPRPIGVALALVRAIWFNYDSGDERLRGMHWMNTMVSSGLQTLFG